MVEQCLPGQTFLTVRTFKSLGGAHLRQMLTFSERSYRVATKFARSILALDFFVAFNLIEVQDVSTARVFVLAFN